MPSTSQHGQHLTGNLISLGREKLQRRKPGTRVMHMTMNPRSTLHWPGSRAKARNKAKAMSNTMLRKPMTK
jgi:hypothetical protein